MIFFEKKTSQGVFLKRYKRFFSDIKLDSGEVVTAHTPNTGSMKTCIGKDFRALVTHANDPKRKLKFTLELTHNGQSWICVNTSLPNKIVKNAILNRQIPELIDFDDLKSEVVFGDSRLDLMLIKNDDKTYIEIKNVTFKEGNKALFPDSVTTRGLKHLNELIKVKQAGHRAVMFYLVNREDVSSFSPAYDIDPEYAKGLNQAIEDGVEVLIYQTRLGPKEITINGPLPLNL